MFSNKKTVDGVITQEFSLGRLLGGVAYAAAGYLVSTKLSK